MGTGLPLSALLSFALVAFTIEADNEAEHSLPHRTTTGGPSTVTGSGPWLTSMAMWLNCMQWVPEQGIAVREVERVARTVTNWDGMRRWGYIFFEPSPDDNRPKPPQSALIVRPTARGRLAQQVWTALIPAIENRWRERFGSQAIDELRSTLIEVAAQLDANLPDCMPILMYGLVDQPPKLSNSSPSAANLAGLALPALLARVLLAFSLDFEREAEVSLAISANILRVIDDTGTRVGDLPVRSGVSKEAIAMALGYLTKRGYAVVEPEARGSRIKVARLTPSGILAQDAYRKLTASIEQRWVKRFGAGVIENLRTSLEALASDGTADRSPLFRGLAPHPEGWRAKVRMPSTLPHYPMVLHRGGYPDGS